jgi:hypothetical protein
MTKRGRDRFEAASRFTRQREHRATRRAGRRAIHGTVPRFGGQSWTAVKPDAVAVWKALNAIEDEPYTRPSFEPEPYHADRRSAG